MPRIRVQQTARPTKEQLDARRELTFARIRSLTGEEAKALLEELIARNEVTGIAVSSQEFVDKVALQKIKPE